MVQTLEAIRGGGGSIKVGTTGKIGALMLRELESVKPVVQTPVAHKSMPPAESASTVGSSAKVVSKSRALVDEASSSSGSSNITKHTTSEVVRKSKHHHKSSNQIPMLESDNISIGGTPIRQKSDKRISYMVEVVDIKCGNPDRAWASPITNRLKKLGFSKLSESII
ncbi:hypothetical protein M9H77_00385 [Catharanthus roseus]|nr:hypothetical protein M9H77_00385 [Catharanthus roseus]